jgi:outer membrane receptor for ferrienterochelin and colicins
MGKIRVWMAWGMAAALIGSQMPAHAQEVGRIEGRVTARKSGGPLSDANVVVRGTFLGSSARGDGTYFVAGVPPGRYEVEASMMGYAAEVKEVIVAAGETAALDFDLEETVLELGWVVVTTATRTPRYVKDLPVRTEVITETAIKDRGAANLYDALEGSPGVRVEQRCSACNFSVLRLQGLEGDYVQVLIDGQPVYSGLAGVYGLQQLPAANIERVEIVKGAGSALYGSSAIAGAVNVVTRQPSATPALEFSSSFGSHKTNRYALASSQALGDQDVVFTAQKNTGEEIDEDGDGLTDRVETDNVALGIGVDWHGLLGDDRLSLKGRTLNESRRGGELATFDNPFARGAEHIETTRYEVSAGYSKKFGFGGELGITAGCAAHDRSATNDTFLSDYQSTHGDAAPSADEMEPYLADESLYVVDANCACPLGTRHRLLVGAQYRRSDLSERGRYVIVDENDPDVGATYTSVGEKHADDMGIYAQGEFLWTENVELVAGSRFDGHRSGASFGGSGEGAPEGTVKLEYDETAFSPRAALRFGVGALTLRGCVGTGFRVPYGFAEELHLCSGSPRVYKPGDLKPEKSCSSNLSADYAGGRYVLGLNLFRTTVRDKVGARGADEAARNLGFTYQWENIGDALTRGIETGARAKLMESLVLDLNLTCTDARFRERRADWVQEHNGRFAEASKFVSRVPTWAGEIEVEFSPARWRIVTQVDYTGAMYIDYNEEDDVASPGSRIIHTDPYWLVNARISREITGTGVSLFAGVRNAFDFVQEERHPDDAAFIFAPLTGRLLYAGIEFNLAGGAAGEAGCKDGSCLNRFPESRREEP